MDPALVALFAAHDLVVEHPPAVLAEAQAWIQDPGITDPSLVDLTALPFCTIDEETSKDLDQALFIDSDVAGTGHVVWYALADASWFVRPGSALWDEALRRGASYYLPGLVAPMLPRILSEDLCSLGPKVDRRALVFRVALDPHGRVTQTRILRARVHSQAKLSYDGVQAWYDGGKPPCEDAAVLTSLERLATVGRLRMALAEERDVVSFRRTEIDVHVARHRAGQPLVFIATTDLRLAVERYNEQVSLLCNMEGARFLQAAQDPKLVQPIYRVHPPPQADRLDTLQRSLDAILAHHKLDPSWRWRRGDETLADYLERLPQGRIATAIHRQAMMSSGRASFTSHAGVHYGIGADVYARFTAPMREIVGVFLHHEAFERLSGHVTPVPDGAPDDAVRREQVIAASNACHMVQKGLDRDANRMVIDHLLAEDLRQKRPPRRRGTVMGFDRRKVHVQLDDPAIDLKVYVHHLEDQTHTRLRVSGDLCSMAPTRGSGLRLSTGDAVDVWVVGEDTGRDRWRLACQPA
ncbi:MAG: RNB domain-containing ribonuclease [Oligoflexia bacterium]|nr:RNB domain-containing ribonuclease [Oligoflexia bacterium]